MIKQKKVVCPLCKNDRLKIIYGADKDYVKDVKYAPADTIKERGAIVKCLNCSVIFKADWPSGKALKEGYEESIDSQYLSLIKERRKSFSLVLKEIENNFPKGRLLDVGCAEGTLVHIAKERGWSSEGIEPNKNFVKWAKKNYKINIAQGSVFNKSLKNNSYDVITLLDVIEHVSQPELFLKRCRELLKDGGYIVISTPNFDSFFSRLMKKKWFYILSIHLFYFTPRTISSILEKVGFSVLRVKPYYLRTSFGYTLEKSVNYLGIIGKIFHKTGKITGINRLNINYCLGQMIVFARK